MSHAWARAWLAGCVWVVVVAMPAWACTGDCNGDGNVDIGEIIIGVNIALENSPLSTCPSFDRDGNGAVSIDELLAAVNAALDGCPTPTPTLSPAPTATPTPNLPPMVPCLGAYAAYTGHLIDLPLPATDPDGDTLSFSSDALPNGAQLDAASGRFTWTPSAAQIGPFFVGYSVSDSGRPPAAVDGLLPIEVLPGDACTTLTCDPATGCSATLASVNTPCCSGPPQLRPARPLLGCPQGAAVFVGRNVSSGFGRLENCDFLKVTNFQQSSAQVRFNVEARCLNAAAPIAIHARLEAASRLLFDHVAQRVFVNGTNGYLEPPAPVQIPVDGGGPFFDLEQEEANLTVTVTDTNNVTATDQVRVVLTFDFDNQLTDLPDTADQTPATPLASCGL